MTAGPTFVERFRNGAARRTLTKDPKKSRLEAMPDATMRRYVKKVSAVIERIAEVGLPKSGEQLRLVTRRKFNAVEFLTHIADSEGVDHLAAAIYSINFQAARLMVQMIEDNRIGYADILMSNLRNGAHREKEVVTREMFETHPRVSLFFCSSHAKVMAMKTRTGNHYVIEGSGNHAENSRVEQYVIDNDPAVYAWACNWMQDIKRFLGG